MLADWEALRPLVSVTLKVTVLVPLAVKVSVRILSSVFFVLEEIPSETSNDVSEPYFSTTVALTRAFVTFCKYNDEILESSVDGLYGVTEKLFISGTMFSGTQIVTDPY